MSEFGFSAKIGADVSGFQKGMLKAEKSLNKFAKGIEGIGKKGIVGSLANVTLAMGGVVTAFKTATRVVKDVAKAVGECTEAYKQQAIVERTLQTAIQNNPYVTGDALSNLKKFASDMQRISNVGDEQIMQLETQLISLGRTEEETMNIIRVAMDMSASGTMSLDTAITQLNATLNGNIGRLGQQNAELKNLTEEELKSGRAVEILGEKFKGLSEATIDTSKQLQNIKGDFKEAIGEFTLPSSDMWNKFWIGFYDKGISVIKQFDEYMDKTIVGKGIADELIKGYKSISDERQKVLYLEDNIHALSETQIVALQKHLESTKNRNKEQEELLRKVKMEVEARTYLAKVYAEMDREEAERQKTEEEQLAIENEIAILKGKYLEKMAEQERKWKNIKDVTGEEVKNEEKIKFYQDSLVDLMTQAGGQITTNNQLYKDQIAIIQKLQAELKPEEEEKQTSNVWVEKIRQQAIERLQAEKETYEQTVDLEKTTALERYLVRKDYNEKIFALQKEQLIAEMDRAMKSVEGTANEYDEKARIAEYYNNEIEKLSKGNTLQMEIEGKKAGNKFAKGFQIAVEGIKKVMAKVVQVVNGMMGKIKGLGNIFKKMFQFNTDDALDSLLEFEDKVLTFFVETLPKLPQFVASAMQSIKVLFQSILQSGGLVNLGDIMGSILSDLINEIPQILKAIVPVVKSIIKAVLDTLSNMNVFEDILDMVVEGFDWLLNAIVDALPTILEGLIKFIEKLTSKLPQIIKIILPAITKIITSIAKALPSLLKAVIPNVLRAILEMVKGLLRELPTIISVLINALPQIISAVIEGLSDFLATLSSKDIAEIISGVIKATTLIASALISNIGKIVVELIPLMAQIIIELIKSVPDIVEGLGTGVWEGAQDLGETLWNGIKSAGEAIKDIGTGIGNAFKKFFGFATGTNDAPKGLALVGEQGPELVQFKGGEKVYNANNTQKMLKSAGGNSNIFNVTFENTIDTTAFAMMKQLRTYQRNLAFNGVL